MPGLNTIKESTENDSNPETNQLNELNFNNSNGPVRIHGSNNVRGILPDELVIVNLNNQNNQLNVTNSNKENIKKYLSNELKDFVEKEILDVFGVKNLSELKKENIDELFKDDNFEFVFNDYIGSIKNHIGKGNKNGKVRLSTEKIKQAIKEILTEISSNKGSLSSNNSSKIKILYDEKPNDDITTRKLKDFFDSNDGKKYIEEKINTGFVDSSKFNEDTFNGDNLFDLLKKKGIKTINMNELLKIIQKKIKNKLNIQEPRPTKQQKNNAKEKKRLSANTKKKYFDIKEKYESQLKNQSLDDIELLKQCVQAYIFLFHNERGILLHKNFTLEYIDFILSTAFILINIHNYIKDKSIQKLLEKQEYVTKINKLSSFIENKRINLLKEREKVASSRNVTVEITPMEIQILKKSLSPLFNIIQGKIQSLQREKLSEQTGMRLNAVDILSKIKMNNEKLAEYSEQINHIKDHNIAMENLKEITDMIYSYSRQSHNPHSREREEISKMVNKLQKLEKAYENKTKELIIFKIRNTKSDEEIDELTYKLRILGLNHTKQNTEQNTEQKSNKPKVSTRRKILRELFGNISLPRTGEVVKTARNMARGTANGMSRFFTRKNEPSHITEQDI